MTLTAGIDVGSTYTKAVLLDGDGRIAGRAMLKTGFKLAEAAERAYDAALADAGVTASDVALRRRHRLRPPPGGVRRRARHRPDGRGARRPRCCSRARARFSTSAARR